MEGIVVRVRRSYLPATTDALVTLGAQVAAGRRRAGWTAVELAERLGVSAPLVARIEKGVPGTAVGTVLEAAILVGVQLYGVEPGRLGEVRERATSSLALLPARVATRPVDVDDEF